MVAFVFSLLVTFAGVGIVLVYAKRRPAGAPLTWGEAMVGSLFAFALMFVAYGIMPHQWLSYADNQLQWRKDKILVGPGDPAYDILRFTVTYEAVRDIIASLLYVVGLGGQIALWSVWQNRGKEKKPKELPTSAFGRPLVKKV